MTRGRSATAPSAAGSGPARSSDDSASPVPEKPDRFTLGILRDKQTDQVPGSVLLLSGPSKRNAPLGSAPRRNSASSLPSQASGARGSSPLSNRSETPDVKRTANGKIILEPQPDDSPNDPLTWAPLRRDAALISLGLYCMLGGGMTTILAAAFTNVAETYDVTIPQVALTTGTYMLGLGVGGVIMSPTAILFGKRPVYLATSLLFILSSIWCALSPNYPSLVVARVVQGITVSPVECLPSATIAEIYFLHERAYRLGIYTLLLLGGKNLVPLVSAAILQSLGWRWIFWIVAMITGLFSIMLFFLVPETFWDRTPRAKLNDTHQRSNIWSHLHRRRSHDPAAELELEPEAKCEDEPASENVAVVSPCQDRAIKRAHFEDSLPPLADALANSSGPDLPAPQPDCQEDEEAALPAVNEKQPYTAYYREAPVKTYRATLRPYNGRLSSANWFRVAARPFLLAAYPSILWSAAVYALSVGWLIIISESVSTIYRSSKYNFTGLQTGLVYMSPFIGGILGTAVAGKVSDYIVRYMSRRNGGLYEPEFRLVMAIPVAVCTTIGLMGYGWSAEEHDKWIVPTVFFGIVSFGCTLGSTTAITFAVDSYRQYAGEALVTLNFAKNVLDGFVFSLFFNRWLDEDGPKDVFLALGGIQLGVLLLTIPMYIYGKRARMWTVRKNFMEKF